MKPLRWALLPLLAVTGCSVGPNYRSPQTAMPADWSTTERGGATNAPAQLARWWTAFGDAQLDALIEQTLQSNLDLRLATARLREARALRGSSLSEFGPSLRGVASHQDSRLSRNAQLFPIDRLESHNYEARFDASWEIDVFGGRRRAYQAARASAEAVEADRRDVLVSVLAEVARNYVEMRGLQRRRAIAHANIADQQAALELTQRRFAAGAASQLEVAQATSLLAGTRAQLPLLETGLKRALHRLAVLQGKPPGALSAELSAPAAIPVTPPEIPVGLPSDLLRRRPDIRRAERQIAAASARVGVQVAELFPKFSLIGSAGFSSISSSDLFAGGSRFWAAGPTVTWRLFEFGRILTQIKAANAREEQALAAYEQTVLLALEEVENALVAYAQEQQRRQALAEQVAADRQAVELAQQLYSKGATSFLNVLDSKRSLYRSEDDLVQSERAVTASLIALYKALGGGWEDIPLP